MSLIVAVNCDTQDLEYGVSGVDWVDLNLTNDELIFSNGSAVVADGESIPSESELTQAGTVISDTVDVIVAKYFLADASEGILREIHNAGNQNKRYVFAFDFDGATASEPVLELWDDDNLNTTDLTSLGAGTPANSWWRGVVTTYGAPGASWVGSKLAGDSSGHYLSLNNENGALSGADTLYCNLKIVIPAGTTSSGLEQPVFVVKYTSN